MVKCRAINLPMLARSPPASTTGEPAAAFGKRPKRDNNFDLASDRVISPRADQAACFRRALIRNNAGAFSVHGPRIYWQSKASMANASQPDLGGDEPRLVRSVSGEDLADAPARDDSIDVPEPDDASAWADDVCFSDDMRNSSHGSLVPSAVSLSKSQLKLRGRDLPDHPWDRLPLHPSNKPPRECENVEGPVCLQFLGLCMKLLNELENLRGVREDEAAELRDDARGLCQDWL